jgi:DNA-binding CsgD family transcriptional regulator
MALSRRSELSTTAACQSSSSSQGEVRRATSRATTAHPHLLAAAIETLGLGLIICDRYGTIVYANPAAETSAISGAGACLSALTAGEFKRFLTLIDAALDQSLSGGLCVQGECGERTFLIVSPISPHSAQHPGLAVVTIRSDDEPLGPGVEAIRQMFRFTPTEADLAHRLLNNQSLGEIRAERGVSENTVRTQLAHVFSKAGVTSQRELVRLLSLVPSSRYQVFNEATSPVQVMTSPTATPSGLTGAFGARR